MLNTRALPPIPMQPVNTPTGTEHNTAADTAVSPAPSRSPQPRSANGSLKRLPVRRSNARPLGRPATLRNPPPADTPHPLLAAVRQPGMAARLDDMRQYLADLKTAHMHGWELPRPRDAQFLDLLVAMENARNPALALSAHTIDYTALRAGDPGAVASLARNLEASLQSGAGWHAVVSVDGHAVALSARHDPKQPHHISLVVVDSAREHLTAPEWNLVAALIGGRLSHKLAQTSGSGDVRLRLHCLNTATQMTNDGGAIFALSAAKAMPGDAEIRQLHDDALAEAAKHADPVDVRMIGDNHLLGARFFKHMTHAFGTEALLKARPDLATQPVSKRSGQPLAEHQAERLLPHLQKYGLRHTYSTSYEDKRLKLYERAVAHLDTSSRLDGMADYLHDLHRARKAKAAPPAPRDAEFLDLLIGVENMLDPKLRLSAHRIDPSKLSAHDISAVDSLKPFLAEGLKSGADWHATLDLGGHHVAVAARHDAEHPTHLSLAVIDGAGSPFLKQDWSDLARTLGKLLDAALHAAGDGRTGKVWLTRLDVSERQDVPSDALFALMAAMGMKGDAKIADVHDQALTKARSTPAFGAVGHINQPDLIEVDDADNAGAQAGQSALDALLKHEQIALYERAIPQIERSLGMPPHTH